MQVAHPAASLCDVHMLTRTSVGLAQGARGPVHAVLSENWAVYHYWSIANRRFEVCFALACAATTHES